MPTSKEIWNRINGRVLELHPKVACTRPSSSLQGSMPKTCTSTLTRHFLPFNSKCVHSSSPRPLTVKTESGHEYLVLTHDPSSSILSVRLLPIDERSLSISGRIAIKGLREKQCFPHEKKVKMMKSLRINIHYRLRLRGNSNSQLLTAEKLKESNRYSYVQELLL